MKMPRVCAPRQVRGVVLFIALIVLVAMSLTGIALIRSVDTALGIAGNLAFKQATVQSADLGTKTAYDWLAARVASAVLLTTDAAAGYFSSRPATEPDWFNLANWGTSVVLNGGVADAAGNVTRYVIHRMCTESSTAYNGSNAGVANQCGLYVPVTTGSTGGSMAVGSATFEGIPQVYYRVTTRVDGPRNTISIIQVSVLVQA